MWQVRFTPHSKKQIKKLDKEIARRVISKLRVISEKDKPQAHCKPLVGNYAGMWRLRVGDYRVVLSFENEQLIILALDIDHRSVVYKNTF